MTATTATPLDSLAERIARHQAELEALRREYETRQSNLADLNRQKEALQAKLQQIEASIQAATQGRPSMPAPAAPKATTAKPAAPPQPKAPARSAPPPSLPGAPRANTLPALLLEIVQKASGPITVRELAEEVVRRKFPTTSSNLPAMVETRAGDLVRKGLLRRASDQPGLVPTTSLAKGAAGKAPPAAKASSKNGAGVAPPKSAPAKSNGQKQQPPLKVVLTNILAKSKKPLMARELADQALASGYKTKSKNFIDVMWVALGQMDNIVNVAGKGYVLKK